MISVIICAYNAEKYIGRTLRSCVSQTLHPREYEIIVVDDGSTDSTPLIIASFGNLPAQPLIRIKTLDKNMGIGYASNEGIKMSLGQFVVRVDSDDFVNEDFLRIEQLFLLENREFDAVSCDYYLVNGATRIRKSALTDPIACGIMFRKDLLINIGMYDENLRINEDVDLYKRFIGEYNIYNIPLPLYRYNKHENNTTLR